MPAQVVVVLREHVLANKTAEALINGKRSSDTLV
jgi:hypothetical protein